MIFMTEEGWIKFFNANGTLWKHDKNPKRPHVELSSGKHSDGFFNGSTVIEDPVLLNMVCTDLLFKLAENCRAADKALAELIDCVIGSAHGASDISYELGRLLGKKRGFTEPQPDKTMLLKRFPVTGRRVLVVEDVKSTGGTTEHTIGEVEKGGGVVFSLIGMVLNRSGNDYIGERLVVALMDIPMEMWDRDKCDLCKAGSVALRPKGTENWAKLRADYTS